LSRTLFLTHRKFTTSGQSRSQSSGCRSIWHGTSGQKQVWTLSESIIMRLTFWLIISSSIWNSLKMNWQWRTS